MSLLAGFAIEDAIVALVALAAFVCIAAAWQAGVVRDPSAARVRELAARRADLREARIQARGRPEQVDKLSPMRALARKLNLLRGDEAQKATDKLAQAGLRGPDVLLKYMFARLLAPFAFGGAGLVLIHWLHLIPVAEAMRLPAVMGLTILGFLAPNLYLNNRAAKRRAAILKALPDGLDLLVICAEAGLSLDAALTRVARELGRSAGELGDEIGLTAVELGFLPDRRQALDNLNRRTGMPAMRGLVNTLQQTEKYGTPLAQSLRVLSAEFRDQRMMRAEEKAARLPAIMTVPMIIFILPALFVVLVGPAALRTIDSLRALH
jgi:tight adherence protein C